jgi:hypothetical protein
MRSPVLAPQMHRSMRSLLAFPLAIALTLTAAASAEAAPGDAALAEALFTSGKEAMARGDFATACARLSESLKLDPAVGTMLNLATCEERSGKIASALERFTAARNQLPADDFRVKFTTERITSLSQRVARLTVRVPSPTDRGGRVLRDGLELAPAALDVPVPVDPGVHVVVLETATKGQPAQTKELTLREGEERVVELRREKAPTTGAPPASVATSTKEDGRGGRRTLALVAAGVGVAGLATGAVTGLFAIDAASTYKTHCENGVCDPDGMDAASTGRTMSVVSPVAFGVGAIGAIASGYLFLSEPKPARPAVGIVPTASPQGAGVSLFRSF